MFKFRLKPSGANPSRPFSWRKDKYLKKRFHSAVYPDDIEALFYDYDSFLTDPLIEQMWVRIQRPLTAGVWEVILQNQPDELKSLQEGDPAIIRITRGIDYPVYLPRAAIEIRNDWYIGCQACGFDMLFGAPATLQARQFRNTPKDAVLEGLTTRCPFCKQIMMVIRWDAEIAGLPRKPRDTLASPLYR
jgi:hypothetical protein